MDSKDLIAQILGEARHYENFSDIEKLVETGQSLANIPLQPLYHALQNSSSDQVAEVLPKLSPIQRQAMIDLDFWKKDVINVEGFEFWLSVYCKCKEDEIVADFVRSEDFLLYLKSRVNIWTFDAEDPLYPDHDYYFLTDDGLLLVEYSSNYNHLAELKFLVKQLYTELGVENAYTLLFKLINDNFSALQEVNYQEKIDRLRDFGVPDYFEAKQQLFAFANLGHLKKFISNKTKLTGAVDSTHLNQKLPSSSLVAFEESSKGINHELDKVSDTKRFDFLSFSFVRTINSTLVTHDALGASRVAQLQVGKNTKALIELGIEFAKTEKEFGKESVLDFFDFSELYKVGSTLIEINKKKLKNALAKTVFENIDKEYFLGPWWNAFLDNTFNDVPSCKSYGAGLQAKTISNIEVYNYWLRQSEQFSQMLPFMEKFHQTIGELLESGSVNDDYYLNYAVDAIDFEAILISSLINFDAKKSGSKMGVTIDELKVFITRYFKLVEQEYSLTQDGNEKLMSQIEAFAKSFGLDIVSDFSIYLYGVIFEHLSGYEYDKLTFEDYQHVGGPVVLKFLNN